MPNPLNICIPETVMRQSPSQRRFGEGDPERIDPQRLHSPDLKGRLMQGDFACDNDDGPEIVTLDVD
jgi:hypothetical protein